MTISYEILVGLIRNNNISSNNNKILCSYKFIAIYISIKLVFHTSEKILL